MEGSHQNTEGFGKGNMEETIDALDLKGLRVIQPVCGYRFGMDSVLLAEFSQPRKGERVLDLGCGDGVLLFLLWGRESSLTGVGLEIREDACDRAERGIHLNGLEERFSVLHGDFRRLKEHVPADSFSLCVCNPPYWRKNDLNDDCARTQVKGDYGAIAKAAAYALRAKGRFCVICPAENFDHLMAECVNSGFALRRFCPVYSRPGCPGKRVLMEFSWRTNSGGAVLLPPGGPGSVPIKNAEAGALGP